ncbi:Probable protein phosphatase 2C 6 (PP2C 6) [Durusdinium trenchii]
MGANSLWSLTWPWAPFLLACLSRAFLSLYLVFLVEGKVIGMVPEIMRSICFYGVAAVLLLWVLRQVAAIFTAHPTPDLRVRVESGSFRDQSVSWLAADMRGWRENMEDAYVVDELRKDLFGDALLFAVLDGHGGREVSALASKLLVREIEVDRRKTETSLELAEVLRQSLPRLDERLRRGSWGIGWLFPGLLHPFATCGSTCVVAGIDFLRRELVVANIGDSRALLIRDGKAIALSEDHKPENPLERNRIRAAGGQVLKIGPCHRVDGNLNLSRAFGDFNLKAASGLPAEKQKVIAVPDVTRTPFQGGSHELLVLACDGLFERNSNQDIANLIWPKLKLGMALEQIATEVLHQCCARSLRGRPIEEGTDNETIILVRLPAVDRRAEEETETRTPLPLQVGQRVRVHGLESETGQKFNGMEGTVEASGATEGRYSVRIAGVGSKSMKPENLIPIEENQGSPA